MASPKSLTLPIHFLGMSSEDVYYTNSLRYLFASVVIIPIVNVLGDVIIPNFLNIGHIKESLSSQRPLASPLPDLLFGWCISKKGTEMNIHTLATWRPWEVHV